GKQRGRTEHVVQLLVADNQPGVDVLYQHDRHDGTVLVEHPALERGEIGGEPGIGQTYRLIVHQVVGSTSGGESGCPGSASGRAVQGTPRRWCQGRRRIGSSLMLLTRTEGWFSKIGRASCRERVEIRTLELIGVNKWEAAYAEEDSR